MKTLIRVAMLLTAVAVLAPALRAEDEAAAKRGVHALLVGVSEYPKLRSELGDEVYRRRIRLLGPENDANLIRSVLTGTLGYPEERITLLAGWGEDETRRPTRANILAALAKLAKSVEKGDHVFILMAGHGSQQPDAQGDELDGLDEIFLPADAGGWKLAKGTVENAITDDEIGARVRAIRDAGATVFIAMDCCHSGTMVRGGAAGVRERRLDADILGVPRPPQARGGGEQGSGGDTGESTGLDGIAALYGAQSYRSAPEMGLPRAAKDAPVHGLLSYLLASQIRRRGGAITFEELHAQLLAAYQALPWYGTMPQAEGDLRMTVGGGRSEGGPLLLVRKGESGSLLLNAGQIAGIETGTVLEIFRPGKLGVEAERLGRLRVTASRIADADLEPVLPEGAEPLDLPDELLPARVVSRPFGDHRLKIACCDADGKPLTEVPDAVSKARKEEGDAFKFPLVDDPEEADWLVVRDGERFSLRPARAGGSGGSFEIADGADLLDRLSRIFRVENLKRLAGSGGMPRLERGLTIRPVRIVEGKETTIRSGDALHPGEQVKIVLKNDSGKTFDLWVFFLDADYGVSVVFPRRGEKPRLTHQETGEVVLGPYPVLDDTLGAEHLLILAIPRGDEDPPVWLDWLEQSPLARSQGGATDRGDGQGGPLGDLLDELAFGTTRGLGGLATGGGAEASVGLVSWRTDWEPTAAPEKFSGGTTPVLGAANANAGRGETTEGWRPAANPARMRDLSGLYEKLAPAVFVVRSRVGHGTGFLIDVKEGLVLTNHHVVDTGFRTSREGQWLLTLVRGETDEDGIMRIVQDDIRAVVVHADERRDLALLKILGSAPWLAKLTPVPISDAAPRPGADCVVLGHPSSGMLWTVRDGHVSGIGRSPHDISDNIVMRLGVSGREKLLAKRQLEGVPAVKIVLSSCQANPGDSGGPLVDKEGRLLGVTHAIPLTERTDKFIYHIHRDEVRAFLAERPDPKKRQPPRVPNVWRIGPNVTLKKSGFTRAAFDILEAGEEEPQQVFFDLDDDSRITSLDSEGVLKLVKDRTFEGEIALHFRIDRRIAFYDTDNAGGYDLVLVDEDEDETADVRYTLGKDGWKVETGLDVPWLTTAHLKSKALRNVARRKLTVLRR